MDDNPRVATAKNIALELISWAAFCAVLAALGGLGRLVWDDLRGVDSPSWLPAWAVVGLGGGIIVAALRQRCKAGGSTPC